MGVRVLYRKEMATDEGGCSPSASKPEKVVDDWVGDSLDIEICGFDPLTLEDLKGVHSAEFVEGVFDGTIANGHRNHSRLVAESTRYTTGSMLQACRTAIRVGVACSPSSGFHHAHHDRAGGYCTFNGLVIAAREIVLENPGMKVGILDCDAHYGDGTAGILRMFPELRRQVMHWTIREDYSAWETSRFLGDLSVVVDAMANECGLIIYQAGADMFEGDPLGSGFLDQDELRERDRIVFDVVSKSKTPIAWNLAGGYCEDFGTVLDIHRATMEECIEAFVG